MASLFLALQCSVCDKTYDDERHALSCECGRPLLAQYDLKKGAVDPNIWASRSKTLWRYQELLPVKIPDNYLTLGEGCTPLLRASVLETKYKTRAIFIKDEGQNPTGSFKARGLCMAIAKAKEMGITEVALPTMGNAGGAAAAYAALAGMKVHIFMPESTPGGIVAECRHLGADVQLVEGGMAEAAMMLQKDPDSKGWHFLSTFREPYRVEGKKTMGFELWEQFNGKLPDVIFYPTGGGTGLVAMWKAFNELEQLGLIGVERPQMIAVQAEGCAPIVKAFRDKADECEPWENPQTVATGLCVPHPLADFMILKILKESNGWAVAVSDYEVLQSSREMASTTGIYPAPEGAATLAAFKKLRQVGKLKGGEQVVLFNTGSGLKYTETYSI